MKKFFLVLLAMAIVLGGCVSCASAKQAKFVGIRFGNADDICAWVEVKGNRVQAAIDDDYIIGTEHIENIRENLDGLYAHTDNLPKPEITAEFDADRELRYILIDDYELEMMYDEELECLLRVKAGDFTENINIKAFFEEYDLSKQLEEVCKIGALEATFTVKKNSDPEFTKTLEVNDKVTVSGNETDGYTVSFD